MSAVLIRDLPRDLHRRLKAEAQRNHRSMNGEIIALLEKGVGGIRPCDLPPPVKGLKPIDPQWIVDIIREARENPP